MTRILLADDHELMRIGLRRVIETRRGWTICAEAMTGTEAVDQAAALQPDIVVLDIKMPEMNGLEAMHRIRRVAPAAKVLVLTVNDSEELAYALVVAGAQGYVLKSDAGHTLIDAIDALVRGKTFFTECVESVVEPSDLFGLRGSPVERLTPRERDVLRLLADGRSNKDIAGALHISPKTAETHRARLMAKLNVHSIVELVRYAIRNKIIDT
jgi:DNA-binding NarL/FixJ family response regulator